jgi:Fe-S cluster biogenesis protein NfuA
VVSLRGGIEAWLGQGGPVVRLGAAAPRTKVRVRLPVVHPERSPFESLVDEWQGDGAEQLEGDALAQRVREVLDECRPMVQQDGGDIELLDIVADMVHVQLTGNCIGCPSSQATLKQGIEARLKRRIPQIKGIASPQLG